MIVWYVLIPLVLIATFIGAMGAYYFKKASATISLNPLKLIKNKYFITGGLLYVFAAVGYVSILKFEDLIVLYPLGSLQYVWAALLATWLLKEKLTKNKVSGIALIMAGVTIMTVFR